MDPIEWPKAPPLPRRVGLTFSTSLWGMVNRRGSSALNTVQPELRTRCDKYCGFRLVRPTVQEEKSWPTK